MSELLTTLKTLRLYGMASAYAEVLDQNGNAGLANDHWLLTHLVQAEQEDRAMRSIRYQLRGARFPLHRDLAGFDFDAAKVDRTLIDQLATLDFTQRAENVVFIGGTGTGKTHLATALGIAAVTRHEKRVRFYSTIELVNALEHEKALGKAGRIASQLMHMDMVILDELGYLPFSQAGGALLFHLLSKLYEHTSVVITTNLVFAEWSSVFITPSSPPPCSIASPIIATSSKPAMSRTASGIAVRQRKRGSSHANRAGKASGRPRAKRSPSKSHSHQQLGVAELLLPIPANV